MSEVASKGGGLEVGEVLDGQYRIEAKIGYGAFGEVYRAWDRSSERPVALKIFNRGGEESGYLRELGLLFSEVHPRIVETYSFGYNRGRRYIVYEYISGGSLRDWLVRSPRMPMGVALTMVGQVSEGIGFAHRRRVVHRDLKPENILLEDPDWPTGVKICDFGLSVRWRDGDRLRSHYGSPAYMAPEQLTGDYDHRVDYYAMGVILYEMLFGKRPYGGSVESIRRAQAEDNLVLPDGLPRAVSQLLGSLLANDPENRPSGPESMERLVSEAVQEVEDGASRGSATSAGSRQEVLSFGWEGRVNSLIDRVGRSEEGALVALTGDRIVRVESEGRIQPLVGAPEGVDGFIEGTSTERDELGWFLNGEFWRYRGGSVQVMGGNYEVPAAMVRVKHVPGQEAILVVQPEQLEVVSWDGEVRWQATFNTYGSVPVVDVGGVEGHIALACDIPRTQLVALSYEGDRLFRTAAQANDPCIMVADDGSTVVGARSTRTLRVFDEQGFVRQTRQLGEGLTDMSLLGGDYLWLRGREKSEIVKARDLRIRARASVPVDQDELVVCGEGVYGLNRDSRSTTITWFELNLH